MASQFYLEGTPADIKEAKGLHLITMSTPNGKKLQIMLEELKETYNTQCKLNFVSIALTSCNKF